MQIYGPGPVHGPHSINPAHLQGTRETSEAQRAVLPQDEVQISEMGKMLEALSEVPDIREDRVAQIRQQIAAGEYETEQKLNLAVDRLLDELV